MAHELAFFPLKLVAFPGEDLNLHIFEPRYKQLVLDCSESNSCFGICTFLDTLMDYGTEVELIEIYKTYEDGSMDIKTKGKRLFKIVDFCNPVSDKLYAGGKVEFLPLDRSATSSKINQFKKRLEEIFKLLHRPVDLSNETIDSFTYAHQVGLKPDQEYELMVLGTEEERLDYLIDHFDKIIPLIKEIESAKNKIKMNGHFKHLDPLNF